MKREYWPSRRIFIYAAIGSAVGLGNVWRFPYLAHEYGGAAFLIPYLIAMFIAGIPLFIAECALGQKFQKGAVDSFAAVRRKFSAVGWWALITAFIVISYYVVVMAWSLIYLFVSLDTQWSDDPERYFTENVLQLSPSIDSIGSIVPAVFISLVVCWILVYFCVWKGVKSVSKVLAWSVPVPLLLLVVLLIRAVTLDGAMMGVAELVKPNFSTLFNSQVWIAAIGQVFFSQSLAFGIMIAYGSKNPKNTELTVSSYSVGITNSLVAILASFVVFATLGFMATEQAVPFGEVVDSGPGLAFVTFPQALSMMPFASFFSILFFLMLLGLAIDSAFSLVESLNTTLYDKTKMKPWLLSLIVCGLCFASGIIFTTNAGLYLLDIVDHFTTNITLIVIGILECIAIGWVYGADKIRGYVNSISESKMSAWFDVCIKYIIPIALIVLLIMQLKTEFSGNYGNYPQWAIILGWMIVLIPLAIALLIPQKKVKVAD